MKMSFLAAVGCALLVSAGLQSQPPKEAKKRITFATNRCFAKGGLGIITTDLYINLKSDKNELLLSGRPNWIGQGVLTPEVVTFFGGSVQSPKMLPEGFDLSDAILVSFERDKVRFFDFGKMSGGYYLRPKG